MELPLPLPRMVCQDCSASHLPKQSGMRPDYIYAEIHLGAEAGRAARTVPFKIKRLRFEDLDDGSARAHIMVRVPCLDGDHMHDIDIGDLFKAPQLFLSGQRRCQNDHPMTFERLGSWEYVDDDDYGGTIEFSGVLRCAVCGISEERALQSAGEVSLDAKTARRVEVDIGDALPVGAPLA